MARPSTRGPSSRLVSRDTLRRGSPIQFFQETIAELRKVVWPSREDTLRLTYIVILLSAAIGALLYGLDNVFSQTFGRYILR
jgi:preprotein translocase SecE subunit